MGAPRSESDLALLQDLERRKKARSMVVPTDDGRVRARLREIGEPITLFGERVRSTYVPIMAFAQAYLPLSRHLTVAIGSSMSFHKSKLQGAVRP